MFKETCAERHQKTVPPKNRYFTLRTVADRHRYAACQQALAAQARITKSSPSAAWKILV